MILENDRKTFQELQNRIIGKILSIIASSLATMQQDHKLHHKRSGLESGFTTCLELDHYYYYQPRCKHMHLHDNMHVAKRHQ